MLNTASFRKLTFLDENGPWITKEAAKKKKQKQTWT